MESACSLLLYRTYQETWKRGQKYYNEDRVKVARHDAKFIEAQVIGTKNYDVRLEFRGGGISRRCSCPVSDFCKHIVAVAICWDKLRGIAPPSAREIDDFAIPPPTISYSDLTKAYDNPLKANLDVIRIASDELGSWSRPHANLPKKPLSLTEIEDQPVTLSFIKKVFSEIKSWSRKYKYDSYFCAGEMVAAYCEVLRDVENRLNSTNILEFAEILVEAQKFHYLLIIRLIDDSDGLHEFTEAHLENLYQKIKSLNTDTKSEEVNSLLKEFDDNRDNY